MFCYFVFMTFLRFTTLIQAPIVRCFDLSRSIELHMLSTYKTGERAIAGKTAGLVDEGDTVTWEAVHFGVRQRLTSRILRVESPVFFSDEMTQGAFKRMYHEHIFEYKDGVTIMNDNFTYEVPYGLAGKIFDRLALKKYMIHLLEERNHTIKRVAESDEWKTILPTDSIYL